MQQSCLNSFDAIDCSDAMEFCYREIVQPFYDTSQQQPSSTPSPPSQCPLTPSPFSSPSEINPYDITESCPNIQEDLCYPSTKHISTYLNDPQVQSRLGVAPQARNYTMVSLEINTAFTQTLDMYQQNSHYVAALLERGIRVLIYVGANDWICNWIGEVRWTLDLEWSGHEEFASQELRDWSLPGSAKRAGLTRSAKGLTFLTLDGAGHMVSLTFLALPYIRAVSDWISRQVPYNKPKESLDMVKRWLAGKDF